MGGKRILVTGLNSYIGNSFIQWLGQNPGTGQAEAISLRDDKWQRIDFSRYDVVFYVAGMAHGRENKKNAHLYFHVNRDLAYQVAQRAKAAGVKHFIYISSMAVYGMPGGVICKDSPLRPVDSYGRSKLEAEDLITALGDDSFMVAIIRPPMVYGKGCKGNYPRLARLARSFPVFPAVDNRRSMIYIDNLCQFVWLLMEKGRGGVFFPQNSEYVNTSRLVQLIAKAHGKSIAATRLFNPLLALFKFGLVQKVLGNLVYEKSMSHLDWGYCLYGLEESVRRTESK